MQDSPAPSIKSPAVSEQIALLAGYEMFLDAGRKHFDGTLGGKLVAGCGMDWSEGARALAASMNGAAFLGIDDDAEKIKQRVKAGYCDAMVNGLEEALRILKNAVRKRTAASVGLVGAPRQVMAEMANRGVVPNLLCEEVGRSGSDAGLGEAVSVLKRYGTVVLSSELSIDSDGHIVVCVALSGEAADIRRTDRLLLELFSANENLTRWIEGVQGRLRHQGLPARVCRLSDEEGRKFGIAMNELVARGELRGPIALAISRNGGEAAEAAVADGSSETATQIERAFAG